MTSLSQAQGKFDFVVEHKINKYITTQPPLPAMFVFSCSFKYIEISMKLKCKRFFFHFVPHT